MRIVFAGTGTFGVPSLDALVRGGHEVELIVTQPDRPAGRGRKVQMGPVHRFASDRDIPVLQPENPSDPKVARRIRRVAADLIVVIAYGQKIPDKLLDIPVHGAINLHGSLLPKYRGAAPVNWALINGERETGLSVIEMNERIDAGDILGQRATNIEDDETAGELHDRLAALGARLVVEIVQDITLDEISPRRQNETQATFAPRLKKNQGRIDWDKPAEDVHNHARGVTPWPGAFTYLPMESRKQPLRLVVNRTTLPPVDDDGEPTVTVPKGTEPGTIIGASDEGIDVATAEGAVRILKITPSGKRTMHAADFLNGYPVEPGVLLGKPTGSAVS